MYRDEAAAPKIIVDEAHKNTDFIPIETGVFGKRSRDLAYENEEDIRNWI